MKQILLLEDLPEIRAWLKALALQVVPDAQISEASPVSATLRLVCEKGASQDQPSVPVTRTPCSSSQSVAALPTPQPEWM